jgi:pimeloyl-ACP methyl ester carboxylesterase
MNRIFLGLTIRGSCEAAWKLSRVGPRGRQAHPQRQAHRFPDLGHAPQIKAPDQVHEALLGGLGAL